MRSWSGSAMSKMTRCSSSPRLRRAIFGHASNGVHVRTSSTRGSTSATPYLCRPPSGRHAHAAAAATTTWPAPDRQGHQEEFRRHDYATTGTTTATTSMRFTPPRIQPIVRGIQAFAHGHQEDLDSEPFTHSHTKLDAAQKARLVAQPLFTASLCSRSHSLARACAHRRTE